MSAVFTDGDWVESKDQSDSGIRLVQTGNVGIGQFKDRSEKARFIDEATFVRLKCFEVLPGDLLISRLPDPVGRACIIPDTGQKMITAVDCSIVRVRDAAIDPQFLVYYTQTHDYLRAVEVRCSGTTRRRISRKNLGNVPVPTPPLEEQKRIVAVLDQAFAALDRARAHAETNLADARNLFESSVDSLLCSRHGWRSGKFREIVGNVFTGPFGSLLHKSDYIEGGIPVINPSNIVNGIIEPDWKKSVSSEAAARLVSYKLSAGDLVIGRRGEMGRCAPVLPHMDGWLCGTGSFIIRPRPNVSSEFVSHLMRTPTMVAALTGLATGATMPNLSNEAIAEMGFELPAHDEQLTLLDTIKGLEGSVRRLQSCFAGKIADLASLRQSILQKAFSAQLP